MAVTKDDIQKLSQLARINLTDSDAGPVTDRVNSVLNMVDTLQAIDTTTVSPMSHPLDAVQRLRADSVTEENQRDALLNNAPEQQDGLFLVPKVIE